MSLAAKNEPAQEMYHQKNNEKRTFRSTNAFSFLFARHCLPFVWNLYMYSLILMSFKGLHKPLPKQMSGPHLRPARNIEKVRTKSKT